MKLDNNTESGNITFYLAFVMPITLVFLTIVVELSQWQFLREEAQREADRIALELGQFLPLKEFTEQAFISRVKEYNQNSKILKVSLDTLQSNENNLGLNAGMVQVKVSGKLDSILDSLMTAFTGEDVTFPIEEIASARVVPSDLMLVISDAVSMRPQAFTTYGSPLDFPQSDYFNFISLPTISVIPPPEPPRAWPNWWLPTVFNNSDFQRWTTQLCFSPITLPLKQGALMIIDQIMSSSQNRIGVYASPGDVYQQVGFSVIKELSYSDSELQPVRWSTYFEPDVPISDEACLMYSHEELNLSRYPIPVNPSEWNLTSNCSNIIITNPFSAPEGHYPNPNKTRLSPCFIGGGAHLREAVFYRAVRMHPHETLGQNVARAMQGALTRLVEEEKIDPSSDLQVRRGLVGNANKILVVISDQIPSLNDPAVTAMLNGFESDKSIKVYIYAYNHQGLSLNTKNLNINNVSQYINLNEERLFAKIVDEFTLAKEVRALLSNEKRIVLSS